MKNKTREIKFRTWDIDNKIMEYIDNKCYWMLHDTYYDVLMQYTGLKDKNKKEIYEGDILEYDGKGCDVVSFEDGSFIVKSKGKYNVAHLNLQQGSVSEVVGNIYENPELLKEKK